MAILKIARMGHPVLARKADPIAEPTHPEVRRLAADMVETMEDAQGTGLAAPQVHVPLRMVVFFVEGGRAAAENTEGAPGQSAEGQSAEGQSAEGPLEADGAVPLTVMINPEIEPLDERRAEGWEACLSVPDLAGRVPRWHRIRYRFTDLKGERHERIAEGFHARVVQHECDHLDGVLYPQRMTDLKSLVFSSEMHHAAEAREPVA